jgi:ribosomal protein S18 acetylase RimI-like enzyme
MIVLKQILPEAADSYKAIRLRALQEAPLAFGSTYARESQFADSVWHERAARCCGDQATGYMAWDGDKACGLVGGLSDPTDASRVHLVSMWVAPEHRGQGVGRLLVAQVHTWARARQAKALLLMVTSSNVGALRFYERLGFTPTGRTEPYPHDAELVEIEMLCPIES